MRQGMRDKGGKFSFSYLKMWSRYDQIWTTINSWWWEHKFLNKMNQSLQMEILRPSATLHYLAYFCLPHIWCSLNIFVAEVGSKVTGTNSTPGLLTSGKQLWTYSGSPPTCWPCDDQEGELDASCLHASAHHRGGLTWLCWAHLTFPWGLDWKDFRIQQQWHRPKKKYCF